MEKYFSKFVVLSSIDIEDMKNIYIVDAQSICQLGIDIWFFTRTRRITRIKLQQHHIDFITDLSHSTSLLPTLMYVYFCVAVTFPSTFHSITKYCAVKKWKFSYPIRHSTQNRKYSHANIYYIYIYMCVYILPYELVYRYTCFNLIYLWISP